MCKRCGRSDQGVILEGLCGNCGDDLRQEADAADYDNYDDWLAAQPREAVPLTDDLPF